MKKVKFIGGVVHTDNRKKQITTFADAATEETKCGGYGIDHDLGILVLPNYNAISGDNLGNIGLYIVDGEVVVEPIATAVTNVKAFKCNPLVKASGVTISGCPTTDLSVGGTVQLTAVVTPVGSTQTGLWTSNNPSVATVSSSGLVTGVSNGNVIITFTADDGDFVAQCAITVVPLQP